jgi:KDO2-lipid IV(A) lauroyltransferase
LKKPNPAYVLYRVGRSIASAIPDRFAIRLAERAGTFASGRNADQRAVVRRNLSRVVGEADIEPLIDAAYRSYARYWIEALRMPKPGLEEIKRRTTHEGLEHLERYRKEGRGVIIVLPHVGSYDVAGAWVASLGWKILAVAEEVEPPELFEMFKNLRKGVGVEILPHGKGSTARALLTALKEGSAIGLVADRDIAGTGIMVPFFGEETLIPNGPAVLALRTGSPIVVGAVYQRPEGYHAVVLEPIEVELERRSAPGRVEELTREVVSRMEDLIRREPGQWHLFQPNWPSDPGYAHSRV